MSGQVSPERQGAGSTPLTSGAVRLHGWCLIGTLFIMMLTGCSGPRLDVSPSALLETGRLKPEVAEALSRADNLSLTSTQRRNAAQSLLTMKGSDAVKARVSTLSDPGDVDTWRAMLQAVIRDDRDLPPDLVRPLLNLLGQVDDNMSADLAQALGLYDDKETYKKIARIATDDDAPIRRRQQAMLALGYQRTKDGAKTLVELTEPSHSTPVREQAFDSLIVMTGRQELHHDYGQWQSWWDRARKLNDVGWYERLTETIERAHTITRDEQELVALRLRESEKARYYTFSEQDKPRVLVDMLSDDLVLMRDVAMELCLERLQEGQRFDNPLRAALRTRMTEDSIPNIRERSAMLLRDLADEPGADMAAVRLSEGRENVSSVLRAYLLLLGRMPRPEAVKPALQMLDHVSLTSEAAAALSAAADHDMLDKKTRDQAARSLRRKLRSQPQPTPQMVILLGKVGDDNDWKMIVEWLDSPNSEIKAAAAQAWGESNKPLRVLADRVSDPVIQPIVYSAANKRGDDAESMRMIASHYPDRQANVDTWRRALVAMSARVPADDVLEVIEIVRERDDSPTQIEAMLAATLDRTAGPALTDKHRIELSLRRAEVRMSRGDFVKALDDYRTAGAYQQQLTQRQMDRLLRGLINSHLSLKQIDAAFSVATQLGAVNNGGDVQMSSDHPAIDLFILSARRLNDEGDDQAANELLNKLDALLGDSIKPEVAAQIDRLKMQIRGGGASAEVKSN